MSEFLEQTQELKNLIALLNAILAGGDNDTVVVNGEAKPSLQKKALDVVNDKISLITTAAADIDAVKYATVADGLAATQNGNHFSVVSDQDAEYLVLYKNNAGTAEKVKTYPSIDAFSTYKQTELNSAISAAGIVDLVQTESLTDGYINSDGQFVSANTYQCTGFIEIEGSATFAFTGRLFSDFAHIAIYDDNKQFMRTILSSGDFLNHLLSVSDARFIRFCSSKSSIDGFAVLVNKTNLTKYFSLTDKKDNAVLKSFNEVNLINSTTLHPQKSIDARNGSLLNNAEYVSTGFIAVKSGIQIRYIGKILNLVGVVGFDKNFQFVKSLIIPADFGGNVEDLVFSIDDPNIEYIRACSKNNVEFKLISNKSDINIESLNALAYYGKSDGLFVNAQNGYLVSDANYESSKMIPVEFMDKIHIKGYMRLGAGIAGYNLAGDFVESIYNPNESGTISEYEFVVSNPNVKFIRACNRKTENIEFEIHKQTLKHSMKSSPSAEVVIVPNTPSDFTVSVLTDDGSYVHHHFTKRDDDLRADHGWYSDWVSHNGVKIAQGNFNFVHMINEPNEDKYVGVGHGCETFKHVTFYADGSEFDPATIDSHIYCHRFSFNFLSDIYVADASREAGEFSQPKLPLEISTQHYMDCEITRNGVERYNKLIIKRDNISFVNLFGAMQQTNQPQINGHLTFNAPLPFRVHFPVSANEPEPLSPDTIDLPGDSAIAHVDKVTAVGEWNGYAYKISTQLNCEDKQKQSVRAWLSRTTSNKIYFCPVVTTYADSALSKPFDVYSSGDVIECRSTTKFDVSKL